MPTYDHRLEFGTFLTPRSSDPQQVVQLAQLSERLGYDLVTVQDHPANPALLDAWTLLAWIAAATERITLAPNVLNLPLREPSVLARAAASLDALSGERVALGLGAGAVPEAIAAMGGRRLVPGEAVDALGEALDVIERLWDTSGRTNVTYQGAHYRLAGAGTPPGPAPRHTIPIWIGAQRPRMLRLIGRRADGWITSHFSLRPGDLRRSNATLDAAARAAGRDPREIRRLLNISGEFTAQREGFLRGTVADWIADLTPLMLEDGIGTFIVMSDDAATLTRFAEDVVPALRAAADAGLVHGAAGRRVRRAAARAQRMQGIDYDAVPASLAQHAVEPGDVSYQRHRAGYMRGGSPGLILRAGSTQEVVDAVAFAQRHRELPLSVRSGGHGISGRSTNRGGLILDVGRMNSIEVLDEAQRLVRIGPGARWMDVARALEPHGWALTSGDYGGVGVGGLATAGGVGFMARQHGLTIDHLVGVEMVLADGSVVRADATENADLFWAVRGAGANFGIVTAFDFVVDEVGDVAWAHFVVDASNLRELLVQWGHAVETAPRDVTSFLLTTPARRGQPALAHIMTMVDSNDPETIIARLTPLARIAPLYQQQVHILSYAEVMANAADVDHGAVGEPVGRSGLLRHITPEFATGAAWLVMNRDAYWLQFRAMGGATSDVAADATAFAWRDAQFSVVAFGANRERLNQQWDALAQHLEGTYLSFETDLRPERLHDAFPPSTLARLRGIKRRYDPTNLFRDNFNIDPGADAVAAAALDAQVQPVTVGTLQEGAIS